MVHTRLSDAAGRREQSGRAGWGRSREAPLGEQQVRAGGIGLPSGTPCAQGRMEGKSWLGFDPGNALLVAV